MTVKYIHTNAAIFLGANCIKTLEELLEIDEKSLTGLLENPSYNEFYVRKRTGGKRLIEDPHEPLKEVQRVLNGYLQSVYYLNRPRPAYGFQLTLKHEKWPRNIKTNAMKHLGKEWMLNVDFKDFFHQVTQDRITELFTGKLFRFSDEVATVLSELCSYKGRLPMGAPTSPVLSNLICIQLDKDLQDFTDFHRMVFTRFADDLTFSSFRPIEKVHKIEIRQIARMHGFEFNDHKLKLMRPGDLKIVTGLKVGEKVEVSDEYLAALEAELQKYAHTIEIYIRNHLDFEHLARHERILKGHMEFVGFVIGKHDPVYQRLRKRFIAPKSVNRYDVVSWLDFEYLHFSK